ncbi:DUF4954 family protein [bacterium]|nr:DUF4954 family protein [bacterium]
MHPLLESLHERTAQSRFLKRIEQCRNAANGWLFGGLLRPLTQEEIRSLQDQGNRSRDWTRIRVCLDFNVQWIWDSIFEGECVLGQFTGRDTALLPGTVLPAGIVRSTILNSQIGNECLIQDAGLVANQLIRDRAVLYRIHALSSEPACTFGNGGPVWVGAVKKEPFPPLFADMNPLLAEAFVSGGNAHSKAGYEDWRRKYIQACSLDFGVVESGAKIMSTHLIQNAFVGASARIEGAFCIADATLDSEAENPVYIGYGAVIRNACLQAGVRVGDLASAEKTVLMEGSRLESRSSVLNGIIGSRSCVRGCRVISSLIGPDLDLHDPAYVSSVTLQPGKGRSVRGAVRPRATGRKRKSSVRKPRDPSTGPLSRKASR